jgi:tRNA A37 threonylcarbamoyladenosine biosynthesis protein TsaE
MDFKKVIKPTFTNSQVELVNKIGEFFKSDKLSFTISGSAGTGKSYITRQIIENIPKHIKIAVSAPTHKAVRVIESFTGKKGHTIHSLHGLRPNYSLDEFNIDNIKYESIGNVKFNEYNVIFIDEASMINKDLKQLNDIRSKQFKTKIVYLGDNLQLAPVKEDSPSDVFNKVDDSFELIDIIRQNETNPLLDIYDILREDVKNNTSKFINKLKLGKDSIINNEGFSILDYPKFKSKIDEYFKSNDFKSDINFCRYAGYTNESVTIWNRYIRTILFPTNELIVVGDLLTAYKTIVDSNNAIVISNSSDYKVLSAMHRISDHGFACYNTVLLSIEDNRTVNVSIVDHTHSTFTKYYSILNKLHRDAHYAKRENRGEAFKRYFMFKDTHLCMTSFTLTDGDKDRGWVTKELSYGYGLTVHKLQGSTISNIFLDALDICYVKSNKMYPRLNNTNNPNAISLRNRLLYTGLTRVTNVAHILH